MTEDKIKVTWKFPCKDLIADKLVRVFHPNSVHRAILDFSKDEVVR